MCNFRRSWLEEIVGEIRDETDVDKSTSISPCWSKIPIVTNGEIEIDTVNEIFKTNVMAEGDDYASRLNGSVT